MKALISGSPFDGQALELSFPAREEMDMHSRARLVNFRGRKFGEIVYKRHVASCFDLRSCFFRLVLNRVWHLSSFVHHSVHRNFIETLRQILSKCIVQDPS